jgi:hypothetical protein
MKVGSRINVKPVMVCRSSNQLAFLMSESGLCRDMSTATVRNIAVKRVKASPNGTYTGDPHLGLTTREAFLGWKSNQEVRDAVESGIRVFRRS